MTTTSHCCVCGCHHCVPREASHVGESVVGGQVRWPVIGIVGHNTTGASPQAAQSGTRYVLLKPDLPARGNSRGKPAEDASGSDVDGDDQVPAPGDSGGRKGGGRGAAGVVLAQPAAGRLAAGVVAGALAGRLARCPACTGASRRVVV